MTTKIIWQRKPVDTPAWEAAVPSIKLRATVTDITCGDYEVAVYVTDASGTEEGYILDYVCHVDQAKALEFAAAYVEEFIATARITLAVG